MAVGNLGVQCGRQPQKWLRIILFGKIIKVVYPKDGFFFPL